MIVIKKYLYTFTFTLTLLGSLFFSASAFAVAPSSAGSDSSSSSSSSNSSNGSSSIQPVDQNTCSSASSGLCGRCDTATYQGECIASKGDPAATTSCTKKSCDLVRKYLDPIINIMAGLVGLIAVGSIIMGGIQFSASAGDPQKAAAARGRIANTIFALIAFFFMYAFLEFLIPGGLFNG